MQIYLLRTLQMDTYSPEPIREMLSLPRLVSAWTDRSVITGSRSELTWANWMRMIR